MKSKDDDYGSEYLRAEDLLYDGKFHTVKVKIEEIIPPDTLVTASKQKIPHPTLRFEGKRKKLVLCSKTNQRMIRHWSGEALEDSKGTEIVLRPSVVPFGSGKNAEQVLAIRVMPPEGTVLAKGIAKMLGEPAVWTPPKGQEKPKKEEQPESTRDKFAKRITELTQSQAKEKATTIMQTLVECKEQGDLSDEEFAELNKQLENKLKEKA